MNARLSDLLPLRVATPFTSAMTLKLGLVVLLAMLPAILIAVTMNAQGIHRTLQADRARTAESTAEIAATRAADRIAEARQQAETLALAWLDQMAPELGQIPDPTGADLTLPMQEIAPLSARLLTLIDGARIYDPHYRLRDQLGENHARARLAGHTSAHVQYIGDEIFRITVPMMSSPSGPGWTLVAVTNQSRMQALLNETCPMTGCQVTLTTDSSGIAPPDPGAAISVPGFDQQGLHVQVAFDATSATPNHDVALLSLGLIAFLATGAAAFLAAHRLVGSPWQDLRAQMRQIIEGTYQRKDPSQHRHGLKDELETLAAEMQGYEANLRSIDATYRAFFEHNKAAAILLDPETLAIKDLNDAACRLYGIGREEAVDVNFMRFVTQAEEIVRKHINQALTGSNDSDYRHKQPHIDHNGASFQAQLHMGPIEIAGRINVYAIIIDITEEEETTKSAEHSWMVAVQERNETKKELQAALAREQQAAAQERATAQAQREFLRMLSHELNTPLAVINSLARALTRKSALDPEVMRTKAGEIMLAVSQASDLVRTHLNTAQYDYDTLGLSFSVHEPGQLAEEVGRAFVDANPHHTFLFDIHDTDVQILLDPGRVTQILNNLISNAVKYSPEGGQIRVSGWADAPNGRYVVEVADEGIGVAPDELERLFEKYYRATNTGSISGSGYGLYMCRRFARLHNGDVTAFSEGRNGTVMTFWLPLKQPSELAEDRNDIHQEEQTAEPMRKAS